MLPIVIKDEVVKQTIHIEPIFPKPLGVIQIDKAINKKILAFMKASGMQSGLNLGNGGNSASVDHFVLNMDELSDIKQVLTDYVNQYFKEIINPGKGVELYITNSWINLTKNGESHHLHKHPNSIVTSILYIDTCEEDTVSLINEHDDIFGNFKFNSTPQTEWCEATWDIPAETGRLIMFPATLPHRVNTRPNTCTGTRISLSFNTWIRGIVGSGANATDQLHL